MSLSLRSSIAETKHVSMKDTDSIYNAVISNELLFNLAKEDKNWFKFLQVAETIVRNKLLDKYESIMPLLRLGNAIARFESYFTTYQFGIHELQYEAGKFCQRQDSAPATSLLDRDNSNINHELNDLTSKFEEFSELLPENDDNDTEADDGTGELMIVRTSHAPCMFKYHLSKFKKALEGIEDGLLKETGRNLYRELESKSSSLLENVSSNQSREELKEIESHLKKLERARFIIEINEESTLETRIEILKNYLLSPGTFPANVREYFKNSLNHIEKSIERRESVLLPVLKFANAVAEVLRSDLSIEESTMEYLFSLIPDLGKDLSNSLNVDIKNYLNVFNRLYVNNQVTTKNASMSLAGEKAVAVGEKKLDISEKLDADRKRDILGHYVEINAAVTKKMTEQRSPISLITDKYPDILKYVHKRIIAEGGTAAVESELHQISQIMRYLKSDNPGFKILSELHNKTVRKSDSLSKAAAVVYSDACFEIKKKLRGESSDISLENLHQVLIEVNKLISFQPQNGELFPLSKLNNLLKIIPPSKVNCKGVIWGSIIGFIGLATIAAGYFFSPMTLGVSAIVGEQLGQAIIMGAGALLVGGGAYVFSSNLSRGLGKSLGGFISTIPKSKRDESEEPLISTSNVQETREDRYSFS